VDKAALSESDICDRYIAPALERARRATEHWPREFGFTDGKMIVRGKLVARGKARRVDYLLFHKPNIPIAAAQLRGAWLSRYTSLRTLGFVRRCRRCRSRIACLMVTTPVLPRPARGPRLRGCSYRPVQR
jgi:hypothetical protein